MKRAREDKALEVWVGRGRKLAGWLTTFKNVSLTWDGLTLNIAAADEFGEMIDEHRAFELTTVKEDVATNDLIWGKVDVNKLAPLYATRQPQPGNKLTRYAWKVLRLDQKDFDWLFDHPDFVPVDTVADRDSQNWARDWFEEHLNSAVPSSAGTYSGLTTNVGSVPGAPSTSSAMTVETLEKATKRLGLVVR